VRVAVASGKGGTGKTTLAVGLAVSLASEGADEPGGGHGPPPLLLDCDVEAPDARVFLRPEIERSVAASVSVPEVHHDRCTLCGDCVEVCAYHALAVLGGQVRLFAELCHGCGSCTLVCPTGAITETSREVGCLELGSGAGVQLAQGILNIGEAMPVPVIRQLKDWARPGPGQVMILDAPPGTSCPMVETVRGSDFVILVTEPTPFGLHDLALAVDVLKELKLPAGIVVNRDGSAYLEMERFCADQGLPILLRIPFERAIAEGIAKGGTLVDVHPEYAALLRQTMASITEIVAGASAAASSTAAASRQTAGGPGHDWRGS